MKVPVLVLLLAVAQTAAAEFTVIEEAPDVTVYREGDHVIVLWETDHPIQLQSFAARRAQGVAYPTPIWDKESRRAGVKTYLSRMRLLDGDLVCEKFAVRPAPESRAHVVAEIAARPCKTGFF